MKSSAMFFFFMLSSALFNRAHTLFYLFYLVGDGGVEKFINEGKADAPKRGGQSDEKRTHIYLFYGIYKGYEAEDRTQHAEEGKEGGDVVVVGIGLVHLLPETHQLLLRQYPVFFSYAIEIRLSLFAQGGYVVEIAKMSIEDAGYVA